MRSYQATSSSWSNALSSESMRTSWRTGANVADVGAPTSRSGESAVRRSGCCGLQLLALAHERVELGVGDLGLVVGEVPLAVVPDLLGELRGTRQVVGLASHHRIYRPAESGRGGGRRSGRGGGRRSGRGRRGGGGGGGVVVVVGAVVVGSTVVGGVLVVVLGGSVVEVVDDDVVVELLLGLPSSSPSLNANAAITPISTTASTMSAPITAFIPFESPPSSSSPGSPGSPPFPPPPPPPAAAPPAAPAPPRQLPASRRSGRRCRRRCRLPWHPSVRPQRRSCRTTWHRARSARRTRRSSGTRRWAPRQAPRVNRAATAWSCTRAASSRAMPSTRSACEAP